MVIDQQADSGTGVGQVSGITGTSGIPAQANQGNGGLLRDAACSRGIELIARITDARRARCVGGAVLAHRHRRSQRVADITI